MKTSLIATALFLAFAGNTVYAQTPPSTDPAATPGVDRRLENQDKRIEQGKQSGALTPREAARLERRDAKIEADVAKAKADGVVTKDERKKLHRELDHQSKAIARQKHDRQHDYNHDGKRDRPKGTR